MTSEKHSIDLFILVEGVLASYLNKIILMKGQSCMQHKDTGDVFPC